MNKFLISSVLLLLATLPTFASQSNGGVAPPLHVLVGKEFTIVFDSNPTTGYSWQLEKPLNKEYVRLRSSNFIAPKSKLTGAPGKEEWLFKAVGKGNTIIHFKYVRSWEKGIPPVKTAQFKVIVK